MDSARADCHRLALAVSCIFGSGRAATSGHQLLDSIERSRELSTRWLSRSQDGFGGYRESEKLFVVATAMRAVEGI